MQNEANSFYAYTLQDGISVAIDTSHYYGQTGNYGGFVDEIRYDSIDSDEVKGVMLPNGRLNTPLSELSVVHEVRKPLQYRKYIDRTLRHLEELGVSPTDEQVEFITKSYNEVVDKYPKQPDLEPMFLSLYARAVKEKHGIDNPTVGDLLRIVLERAGRDLSVYGFTEQQKREIGGKNARIAARKTGRQTALRMSMDR